MRLAEPVSIATAFMDDLLQGETFQLKEKYFDRGE